jgi:hypothetical protein
MSNPNQEHYLLSAVRDCLVNILLTLLLNCELRREASRQAGTDGRSARDKTVGEETDHSPPSSVELRMRAAIPPFHNTSS